MLSCAEPDSLTATYDVQDIDFEIISVTKEMDLRLKSTQDMMIEKLEERGDALWHSSPCTGGCGWQRVNMTLGASTRAKVKQHWKLFKQLWVAFVRVAEIVIPRGVSVCIEWPRSCAYWHDKAVKKFLENGTSNRPPSMDACTVSSLTNR